MHIEAIIAFINQLLKVELVRFYLFEDLKFKYCRQNKKLLCKFFLFVNNKLIFYEKYKLY